MIFTDALQILLSREKQLPVKEKEFRLKRLDIVLTLRSLSYSRVQEIKKQENQKMYMVIVVWLVLVVYLNFLRYILYNN